MTERRRREIDGLERKLTNLTVLSVFEILGAIPSLIFWWDYGGIIKIMYILLAVIVLVIVLLFFSWRNFVIGALGFSKGIANALLFILIPTGLFILFSIFIFNRIGP